MAKVFFPHDYILVDSNSNKHPANTQYKVSIGPEDWNGTHVEVIKVQMMYGGKISGRSKQAQSQAPLLEYQSKLNRKRLR